MKYKQVPPKSPPSWRFKRGEERINVWWRSITKANDANGLLETRSLKRLLRQYSSFSVVLYQLLTRVQQWNEQGEHNWQIVMDEVSKKLDTILVVTKSLQSVTSIRVLFPLCSKKTKSTANTSSVQSVNVSYRAIPKTNVDWQAFTEFTVKK